MSVVDGFKFHHLGSSILIMRITQLKRKGNKWFISKSIYSEDKHINNQNKNGPDNIIGLKHSISMHIFCLFIGIDTAFYRIRITLIKRIHRMKRMNYEYRSQ